MTELTAKPISKHSLKEIEREIQGFKPKEQKILLSDLPHLLKFSLSDLAFLKLSEGSFDFWNNPDDAIYDEL